MKQFLIISFLTITAFSFGQTNVIAMKSHSGEIASLSDETDNFGLPAQKIDSIIYVGNECILQVSHYFDGYYDRDTICDPYLFVEYDFDLEKIKSMYGSHVVFLGFENYKANTTKTKKSRRSKGAIPFIMILVATAGYFFRKQTKISVD